MENNNYNLSSEKICFNTIYKGLRLLFICKYLVVYSLLMVPVLVLISYYFGAFSPKFMLIVGSIIISLYSANILSGISGFMFLSAPQDSNAGRYALLLSITPLLWLIAGLVIFVMYIVPDFMRDLTFYLGSNLRVGLIYIIGLLSFANPFFIANYMLKISEYLQSIKSENYCKDSIFFEKRFFLCCIFICFTNWIPSWLPPNPSDINPTLSIFLVIIFSLGFLCYVLAIYYALAVLRRLEKALLELFLFIKNKL